MIYPPPSNDHISHQRVKLGNSSSSKVPVLSGGYVSFPWREYPGWLKKNLGSFFNWKKNTTTTSEDIGKKHPFWCVSRSCKKKNTASGRKIRYSLRIHRVAPSQGGWHNFLPIPIYFFNFKLVGFLRGAKTKIGSKSFPQNTRWAPRTSYK